MTHVERISSGKRPSTLQRREEKRSLAQTGGPLHTGGQPLPLRCSGQQPWPSEPLPDVLHGATREGCAIARTNTLGSPKRRPLRARYARRPK